MAAIPIDADLASRLSQFLFGLDELTREHDITIAFITGQEYLENTAGDSLPVRINRVNGCYVLEEPYT